MTSGKGLSGASGCPMRPLENAPSVTNGRVRPHIRSARAVESPSMTLQSSYAIRPPVLGVLSISCLVALTALACGPPDGDVQGTAPEEGQEGITASVDGDSTEVTGEASELLENGPQVAGEDSGTEEARPADAKAGDAADGDSSLPTLEELEAAMLVVPPELAVVADEAQRMESDPKDYPLPATVGGVPVRVLREFHPTSGVLMRIKSVRADSVDSEEGVVLHGPEWAYFNTAALASIKWWKDDVPHGPVQHWRRVGTRKSEGRFIDGEREGLQQTYSKNGMMIKRGVYADGRRLGTHEEWFASGQRMSSEEFKNDRLHGPRRVWDRDGLLMQSENYVDGKRHGRWSDFHPGDGDPREWGEFDHGLRTGVWERGSKEGVVLESGQFVEDRRDGVTKKWNEAGQLIEEVTYVLGARTGPRRTWYDDGVLQSEGNLEDGLRTGYWRYQKANGDLNELWSGEYAEDQRIGPGDPPE